MANHYVSAQHGNDANDGHSVVNAKATLGSLITAGLVAGDVVYIGPGTYREKVTMAASGSAGNTIKFYGDPGARYVTSDTPGIVRITGCDANESPSSGAAIWAFNAKQYIDIYDLLIDGNSDASGSYAAINGYDNITVTRCTAIGAWRGMAVGGTAYNCLFLGGESGAGAIVGYDCLCMGGSYGVYSGSYYGCIAVSGGSQAAFANITTCQNCLAVGSYYGFRGTTNSTCYNCVAMNCQRGFYWANSASPPSWVNCLAVNCGYGYSNSGTTYKPTVTSCVGYLNSTLYEGSSTYYSAVPTAGYAAHFFHNQTYALLVRAFEPLLLAKGIRDLGHNTYDPTADILGRPHEPGSSTCDIGPYEQPNTSLSFTAGDYNTTPPGFKIAQAGQHVLTVQAQESKTVTATVYTKWVNGTTKPQIILAGRSITTQTATNTAASDTWQQLTVSATLAEDDQLTLTLYAQDNTAGHISYFSDIDIRIA